jgi:hypothetical protein
MTQLSTAIAKQAWTKEDAERASLMAPAVFDKLQEECIGTPHSPKYAGNFFVFLVQCLSQANQCKNRGPRQKSLVRAHLSARAALLLTAVIDNPDYPGLADIQRALAANPSGYISMNSYADAYIGIASDELKTHGFNRLQKLGPRYLATVGLLQAYYNKIGANDNIPSIT